jgi:aspartate racemase
MKNDTPLLGVLGGMGPLATVDFLAKLIAETPAQCDQDHIPLVAYSVPQIPDRPAAIVGNGASPLPAMLEGVRVLKQAGAGAIAIPCNTAHYWYDDIARVAGMPVLHIADAACDALEQRKVRAERVGLMGTDGTLAAGFLQARLEGRAIEPVLNTREEQAEWVLPAIACVKAHDLRRAHSLVCRACEALESRGAQAIILACTEIPVALYHAASPHAAITIDATRALAQACVAWWMNNEGRC